MDHDTKALLLECGAGVQMAVGAIDDVLGQTRDKKLEQALLSCREAHKALAVSPADETVADLITDGCNMGVKSLIRYRNRYPNASETARQIAGQLIDSEQTLCKSMQAYL